MFKSVTNIKVRYAETDKMGIVYHSNYYIYFEVAREDFIKEAGIMYKDLEDMGIIMPIVETRCKYHEGAKYADELIIETSLKEISPVKVVLKYDVIRKNDNKAIAEGETTQTFVDKDSFRIVNLKKRYTEIWNKMCALK
ncbi:MULTISPECIES: acyl-CoA thioesterase [Clostridium]|uniref:acyl-CoA thioesterase n=1 Tax=Clostridium TaxID=1485 RepID=UPI00069EC474|nr:MULTISPECIES: thioesterase family protein [Clostridium]KOF58155.1 4-hydroxybenzoyl-CoA thioesterase [Clostridium sp. DMHC 10]MCD2348968.1 acyl-CoA thioesterase [Clostridium guangxiense]